MDPERSRHVISRREVVFRRLPNLGLGAFFFLVDSSHPKPSQIAQPDASPVPVEPGLFVRGLCYGPFRDGQDGGWGPYPGEDDLWGDMPLLSLAANAIRTYGTENGLERIPAVALESSPQLKVNVGAWIGQDLDANGRQIANLIKTVRSFSNVDRVTVGSEVMLRGDVTEDQLIEYIRQVKREIGLPVTTAETWSRWLDHPRLAQEVDFLQVNIFPYWEDPIAIPIDRAVPFIIEKYQAVKLQYPDKPIVIGETGWPTGGETRGGAVPGLENQRRFIKEFLAWALPGGVDFYFFEAFDENWKGRLGGEVEKQWGIYSSDRKPKHPEPINLVGNQT